MERFLSEVEPASIALATVILGVAGLLGHREWLDRRARSPEQSHDDRDHLGRRDRRRSLGLSILCILAPGIVIGSRIPSRVGRAPNLLFLEVWLGIFALIMGLVSLALVDWFDLRRYARQKRSAIGREQITLLHNELSRHEDGPPSATAPKDL